MVKVIDIYFLKFLIEKVKEAAINIKNEDIILLLGTLGSGKSTTIHFLAGSKMEKIKVDIGNGKTVSHI